MVDLDEAPLVTITVCVRDGEKWVDGCLSSLVSQDWPNIEIRSFDFMQTNKQVFDYSHIQQVNNNNKIKEEIYGCQTSQGIPKTLCHFTSLFI